MDTASRHVLCEYYGCDAGLLQDRGLIEELLERAAAAAGATVVGKVFHRYSPQGVSGVVLVAESHFSIHTWPEHRFAAADFFTCGDCRPEDAHPVLRRGLRAEHAEVMVLDRGMGMRSIQVRGHRREPGAAR
jgi:S-adenosylmethionine decarboxylase proenzyme